MPFVGASMASTLQGLLSSQGMIGSQLITLCMAIGTGCQLGIVGKPFSTTDVGLMPGIGSGIGTGLILSPGTIGPNILAQASSAGMVGSQLPILADAIEQALIATAALITLTSNHAPVFSGAGTVLPGSVLVVGSELGSQISAQGASSGFIGSQWPLFANAVGTGCGLGFPTANGVVTISGAFTGPVPPGPLPGAGSGTGVLA